MPLSKSDNKAEFISNDEAVGLIAQLPEKLQARGRELLERNIYSLKDELEALNSLGRMPVPLQDYACKLLYQDHRFPTDALREASDLEKIHQLPVGNLKEYAEQFLAKGLNPSGALEDAYAMIKIDELPAHQRHTLITQVENGYPATLALRKAVSTDTRKRLDENGIR